VQSLRIMMVDLRARCVLAAAESAADPGPLVRRASRYARRLDREATPMSKPFAAALHAGIAARRGRADQSIHHLQRALRHYETFDDQLRTAAMHHLLGRYLPDDAGAPHRAAAAAGFERARVRRPDGMVALYAPGHGTHR
jgi:hypothetical protein